MVKKYAVDELSHLNVDSMKIIILSMQDQLEQLNQNMERLIEQNAVANNQRFGRSSEQLEVIDGQLNLDFIFNEAEALTKTLYVVEPAQEDVLPQKSLLRNSIVTPSIVASIYNAKYVNGMQLDRINKEYLRKKNALARG